MTELPQTLVYKILSAPDYAVATELGYSKTALDEGDGYVHLSTRAQVEETLRLHYAGQQDVRLLEFVLEHFRGDVRWEESRGGQSFPHLYGTLRLDAAKREWVLGNADNGTPELPADIDI